MWPSKLPQGQKKNLLYETLLLVISEFVKCTENDLNVIPN